MKRLFHIFTIIELLVVVSIISVLITMLLPALSSARGKSMQIFCAGNMKQHGQGLFMYANDYDGCLPAYLWKDYIGSSMCFPYFLVPYMNINPNGKGGYHFYEPKASCFWDTREQIPDLFICPSIQAPGQAACWYGGTSIPERSTGTYVPTKSNCDDAKTGGWIRKLTYDENNVHLTGRKVVNVGAGSVIVHDGTYRTYTWGTTLAGSMFPTYNSLTQFAMNHDHYRSDNYLFIDGHVRNYRYRGGPLFMSYGGSSSTTTNDPSKVFTPIE